MAYITLYREWRPKKFADIVGQEHISKTLQNAIEANRTAHAYLFCGPRGTGKTSTAKVLAKALNCLEGPMIEPCNNCENCNRINEGTSYDVIEIDAASNRGIDEIRDLREKVKYAPAEGKYKIYIIDEVHMLTTEAFNALLKTLEEPPHHVVFILATTEPHKIPLTILSRCQRFDFHRIGLQDIIERLKYIAAHEKIEIDENALRIIAKRAEGGMRDALSILDQCISFSGKSITIDDITTILGTVNEELLQKISSAIIDRDTTLCLCLVDDMLKQGKDARQFIKDLIEYFRNVLLVQVCEQVDGLVNVSDSALSVLQNQSEKVSKENILKIIDVFTDTEKDMKWTTQPRLILELGVIKASQIEKDIAIEAIHLSVNEMVNPASNTIIKEKTPLPAQSSVKEPKNNKVSDGQEKEDSNTLHLDMIVSDEPEYTTKIIDSWNDILNAVKKVKMSAYAFLVEGQPLVISNKTLMVGFKEGYAFHKEKVEQADNRTAVEKVLQQITGTELKVKCIFIEEENTAPEKGSSADENALVKKATEVFGVEVIEIND